MKLKRDDDIGPYSLFMSLCLFLWISIDSNASSCLIDRHGFNSFRFFKFVSVILACNFFNACSATADFGSIEFYVCAVLFVSCEYFVSALSYVYFLAEIT